MPPKTRLAFEARVTSVGVKPAKDIAAKGKCELGLTVEQPEPPRPPAIPWEFADGPSRNHWKPRPSPGRPKAKESDQEYEARKGEVLKEQDRYDKARVTFDLAFGQHQEKLVVYRRQVMAYAQLVGLAAVFGNQVVSVAITPANQDLLPGFAEELISAVRVDSDPADDAAPADEASSKG